LTSFDDPHFCPPADIRAVEARAYEEKIVDMLREELLTSPGPKRFLQSIELRGERPDTEIIFRYMDIDTPGEFAVRTELWKYGWPFTGVEPATTLYDAASLGGWIFMAWMAGELEPVGDA
jgi:hypothetical protein